MTDIRFGYDRIQNMWVPGLETEKPKDEWVLPEEISSDFHKLNSIIGVKYEREFLKVCAFYNKRFPTFKSSGINRTFYNVPSFTSMNQERQDTGTGMNINKLKQTIDQVVSRIGTLTFDPMLIADVPSLEYIVYKDEVERRLRKDIRNDDLNQLSMEAFHDASILGYSHALIDPYTDQWVKMNDYNVGMFEAQFNNKDVQQALFRNYAFPVTSLIPYIKGMSEAAIEKVREEYGTRDTVDFKMYIDCTAHKVWVVLGSTVLEPKEYPFDNVQMATFVWDTGVTRSATTSLFDLLYPVQREADRVIEKMQQLIRMYKGPVPVFSNEVDLAMKQITNGTGECLYVDSTRPLDSLMTVINPTPLDSALSNEITNHFNYMEMLAGLQSVTFDAENLRSAAAFVAMDQTHDNIYNAQKLGMARFIKDMFTTRVHYNSKMKTADTTDWEAFDLLVHNAMIELTPVHINDLLGNQAEAKGNAPIDYQKMQTSRIMLSIMKGEQKYADLPYTCEKDDVVMLCAYKMVELDALGIIVPDSMQQFMIDAFVDQVMLGQIQLDSTPNMAEQAVVDVPPQGGEPVNG
jgi:hypothetical protein